MIQRTTLAKTIAALSVLVLFAAAVSVAQVGHDPRNSPYHDLRRGMGGYFQVGYLSGARGKVPVGHSNGMTYTVGYELSISQSPTSFWTTVSYALTDRFVIDPYKDDSVRKSGPFPDDMLLIDLGLRFNLTGMKSWHGLVPYVSGSAGLAISSGSPPDSSGYQFRRKLTFSPGLGFKLVPGRRLAINVEGRAVFWRLTYPLAFKQVLSSDGIPALAGDQKDTEWIAHPWVRVGVGWTF
jgi:hypothetical protein